MKITATDVKNAFGKYLQYALDGHEVVITKNGRSVAKIEKLSDEVIREEEALYLTNRKMTYSQFVAYTEDSDFRYELIDGEVYLLASPSFDHQNITVKLLSHFLNFLNDKPCDILVAPLDVRLKRDEADQNINVVQPDLLVICDKENIEDGKYMGTPLLVIEILSPSTRSKDMLKKLDLYKDSGISEYWVVDPEQKLIHIYALKDKDLENFATFKGEELTSFCYPELKIDTQAIF